MKAKYVVNVMIIFGICSAILIRNRRIKQRNVINTTVQISKPERYNRLLIKWKNAELKGNSIAGLLRQKGVTKVAVYGMAPDGIGWLLCNSLINDGIEVAYGIDSNAEKISCLAFADIPDVRLMLPDEELSPVDLIIVTAILSFDEIKEKIRARYSYRVISLEGLVEEL